MLSSSVAVAPLIREPLHAPVAHLIRGGVVEGIHYGSVVVLGAEGKVQLQLGDIEAAFYPRSALKPVQAVAMVRAGLPLDGELLSLTAASHSGEERHLAGTRRILELAGLTEDHLRNVTDMPFDPVVRDEWIRTGRLPSRLAQNCSGKHAAMLYTCRLNGWSLDGYLDPEHPLQQHIRATMAELTGVPVGHDAIDGCGAPLFGTSVRGIARAFGRLVQAEPGTPERAVADAMREHPYYVGGTGHQNTTLMETVPGALAKGGAEGVIGVAAADGTAVAMKIVDGSPRATTLIALRVLEALGTPIADARALTDLPVLGGGVPVGAIELGADLTAALERLA